MTRTARRPRGRARVAHELPGGALGDWLRLEQTVNERLINPRVHDPIVRRGNTVARHLRPEARPTWPLEVVLAPSADVRPYGPVRQRLASVLGLQLPTASSPLFVHPQSRRLYARHGARGQRTSGLVATPTASHRSVLAFGGGRAAILKLSLDATIGRIRRTLREDQIARGLLISRLLDLIPEEQVRRLGLLWFPERAGVVDARAGHGWLLRELPEPLAGMAEEARTLIPAFSLVSRASRSPGASRGGAPLLVDLIRASGTRPELFVIQHVLVPYVNALAYLLLGEGLELEGHMQNVLYERGSSGALTGRIALRDLSDVSVNVALRIARDRPLPRPPRGFLPAARALPAFADGTPFSFASNAADFRVNGGRPRVMRAGDTVERYGLQSFVWTLARALRRDFPGYDAVAVARTYVAMWQRAAVGYLGVRPLERPRGRSPGPIGLAMDEAIAYALGRVDWQARAGGRRVALPADAEPLLLAGPAPRRPGRVYLRVSCGWGELFSDGGLPTFFRSAF